MFKEGWETLVIRKRTIIMNVLLIGGFASGKKMFVNSLLCGNFVPTSPVPYNLLASMNFYYRIIFGERNGAVLTLKEQITNSMVDKASKTVLRHIAKYGINNVPPLILDESEFSEEINHYQSENILNEEQCIYSNIDIRINNRLLKDISLCLFNGIYYTNSFSDCINSLIITTDAIVFLFDASRACSKDEMELIEILPSEKLFFVVNKMDQISENERKQLIEYINYKLLDKTSYPISYISSLLAIQAVERRDINLYQKSGLPFFISNLMMNINQIR